MEEVLGWFCLVTTGVGLTVGVGAFLYNRFYSLESRLQAQENRVKTLEDRLRDLNIQPIVEIPSEPTVELPPVIEPLPAIPEVAVPATGKVKTPTHLSELPQIPEQAVEPQPVKIELPILDSPPIVEPEPVDKIFTEEAKGSGGWEMKLGTVWLVRVGVLAFLVFLVLLGRYGYKQVDVNIRPWVNMSLLYLFSFGLMVVGLFLHKRFEKLKDYSEVLTGGGMAAVYFSTFALYAVEDTKILGLIKNPLLAGMLLGVWAIFIIIFATHKRSEIMAMFALAGAYFASYMPLIYDSSGGNIWFTFASNIMLAVAATFFVIKNRWANLSFLALVSSYIGFGYWRFVHPAGTESSFGQDALFLGVYWIIFTAAGFLSRHGQLTPAKRATFINLNNGAFFTLMTITLLMQKPELRDFYWVLPMAFAPVLFGLFTLAKRTLPEEKLLAETLLAKAAVVLTLALMTLNPVEQHRALLLAAECVTVLFFGLRTGNRLLQYAAASIALVGAAFVGIELGQTAWNERGGFDSPSLILGLAFGLFLLVAAWVGRHWEGEREPTDPLRSLPDYLGTIGLAAGLLTCFAVTAKDHPATTAFGLAAFGIIALASRSLMRITAVMVFGEIYLIIGLILWLPLGFSQNPATLETWNPLVMLAIFALAQQWHQRFAGTEEDPAPFISTICQGASVIGLGLIAIAWTLQLLAFETTHLSVSAVVLGLVFAAYSYGLRSGQVFTLGQFFLIGAPVLCVIQTIPNPPTITWQWSLLPLFAALANGLVLERAKESLAGRLAMPVVSFGILGGAAQVAGLLAGLIVALEFVPLEHQLWTLPLVGVALSTFCLGVRLKLGLIAAQGFMLTAAFLSLLSIIKMSAPGTVSFFTSSVPDADGLSTLLPALGLLGMSHFALYTRDLIDETERAFRQLANEGASLYFYLGWTLSMVWAFQFIDGQFIFLLFIVIAILHAALYHRRERIERAIVGGGFLLVGFISFWMHAMANWGATEWVDKRPLDIVPLLLLLGAQWLARKKITEERFIDGAHIAIIVLMNLSLWQWVIRMWPGDTSVISWGTLAFVLIGLGLWAKERTHRISGLLVLLAAMINLTLLASRKLEGMAELLTYLGMSVILIVLGLLYIKFQDKLKEYL